MRDELRIRAGMEVMAFTPAEVDAVVLRIRPREVRARVMLARGRAAEARGQRRLRPRGNHDAETAAGAEDRAVHVVGAIADGEFSRSDVVENLRVGPRV